MVEKCKFCIKISHVFKYKTKQYQKFQLLERVRKFRIKQKPNMDIREIIKSICCTIIYDLIHANIYSFWIIFVFLNN